MGAGEEGVGSSVGIRVGQRAKDGAVGVNVGPRIGVGLRGALSGQWGLGVGLRGQVGGQWGPGKEGVGASEGPGMGKGVRAERGGGPMGDWKGRMGGGGQ